MPVAVGDIVEGSIARLMDFGFFVDLPGGESGLVHISEVSESYVKDLRELFKERDKVTVKVMAINDNGKIELSVRRAKPPEARPFQPQGSYQSRPKGRSAGEPTEFEGLLSSFMKKSEERLLDLKRNTESKRGGRTRRR